MSGWVQETERKMAEKKYSVCVVDDETELCETYSEMLMDEYEVRSFDSSLEALAAISRGYKPNVIVTDLRMPGLDGLNMLLRAKEIGIPSRTILMSGHADRSDLIKAISSGIDSFLEKPFSTDELRKAVAQAIYSQIPLEELVVKLTELNESYFNRLVLAEDQLFANSDSVLDKEKKLKLLESIRSERVISKRIASLESTIRKGKAS